MKWIIINIAMLFVFCAPTIAQTKNIDGIYHDKYTHGFIIEIKNDSFRYSYTGLEYYHVFMGNDRKGTYTKVNNHILKFNNEDPVERLSKELKIRKYSDTVVPHDSIELHIILGDGEWADFVVDPFLMRISGYGSGEYIERTLMAQKAINVVRIPRINGDMNVILTDVYGTHMVPFMGSWSGEVAPTLIVEKNNICTVMPEDDVIEFDFRSMDSSIFYGDVIIKDDYVLFDKGKLIYHGEVFGKCKHGKKVVKTKIKYKKSMDGLYCTSDSSVWIRLRNDTFECSLTAAESDNITRNGVSVTGRYRQVSDSLLEFNTESPEKWIRNNVVVRKYMDNQIPSDSIKVRIIIPLTDSLLVSLYLWDIHISSGTICVTDKDTTDIFLSKMTGKLDCSLYSYSIEELLAIKRNYHVFPISGMLHALDICSVTQDENVVELDFSKVVPHPLLYMYLKGEYVLIDGDKLLWHGLVFRKI